MKIKSAFAGRVKYNILGRDNYIKRVGNIAIVAMIILIPSFVFSHYDAWGPAHHRKEQGCNGAVHFHFPEYMDTGYFDQTCPGWISDNLISVCSCNGEFLKYIDYDPETGLYDGINDTPLYDMRIECSLPVGYYQAHYGLEELLPYESILDCYDEVCGGFAYPDEICYLEYGGGCSQWGCREGVPPTSSCAECPQEQSLLDSETCTCGCNQDYKNACLAVSEAVFDDNTCLCNCNLPPINDLWVNLDCENKLATVNAWNGGENNSLYEPSGRLYRWVNNREVFIGNVSGSFSTSNLAPGSYYIVYDDVNIYCFEHRYNWYVNIEIDAACSGGCILIPSSDGGPPVE